MIKTYKYRLYPNKKQIEALNKQFDGHRFLYNEGIAERKQIYLQDKRSIRFFEQNKTLLPRLKKINPIIANCNYSSLQRTLRRLDQTYEAFFRNKASGEKCSYPRFKSAHRFRTISYGAISDGWQIKDRRLYIQNVGNIKVKWHRNLDDKPKIISLTRKNQRWYVLFIAEVSPRPQPKTGKEIGIDVGLNAFITTSDGIQIDTPRFFKQTKKSFAKAQRRIFRREKNSHRRLKARYLASRKDEKIANRRRNFCHQLTSHLVKSYDGFAVEKINIKGLMCNKRISKAIKDAGWGMFLNILRVKAESAGRWYEEVDPKRTSIRCSRCGTHIAKTLDTRIHCCNICGLKLDRDINAARNILQMARTGPSGRDRISDLCELKSCRSKLTESSLVGCSPEFVK